MAGMNQRPKRRQIQRRSGSKKMTARRSAGLETTLRMKFTKGRRPKPRCQSNVQKALFGRARRKSTYGVL